MRRLVYAPSVEAYIRSEEAGVVFDVSKDIINGTVSRRLDATSDASLTLQNKFGKYTRKIKPMDRIAIYLTRMGEPTLAFTGYVDNAPFYQLVPRPITINATCTLKLIQNTYFDPGLPFMTQWFQRYGWTWNAETGTLSDPFHGFGNLDYREDGEKGNVARLIAGALVDIGGWPADHIWVRSIPGKFVNTMKSLLKKETQQSEAEFEQLILRLEALLGVGIVDVTDTGDEGQEDAPGQVSPQTGNISMEEVAKAAYLAGFRGEALVEAVAVTVPESGLRTDVYNGICCDGLWQINRIHKPAAMSLEEWLRRMHTPLLNAQEAYRIWVGAGKIFSTPQNHNPWQAHGEGRHLDYMNAAKRAVDSYLAKRADGSGYDPSRKGKEPAEGTTTQWLTGAQDKQKKKDERTQKQRTGSATANKVVAIAMAESRKNINEEGSTNAGPEIVKYQETTGALNQPWCGSFVTWIFLQAGVDIRKGISNPAAVTNITKTAESKGWVSKTPFPGAIVTFGRDDHVGIVVGSKGNTLYTVEGNTGPGVVRANTRTIDSTMMFVAIPGVGKGDPDAALDADESGDTTSGGEMTDERIAQIARQAAWFSMTLPSVDTLSSIMLTGKRAIQNDITLFDWIQAMVTASGRRFMSMPNGDFMSFFPDYFNLHGRNPYFLIRDIEIIDLTIDVSDKELVTHLFVSGTSSSPTMFNWDRFQSMYASVQEDAFSVFINTNDADIKGKKTKTTATFKPNEFLQRYGVRPKTLELPEIRHPTLLWMAAWTEFSKYWANQFQAQAQFTFLPELIPGGVVEFDNKITMFVEEVTHTFDMEAGFTTNATLSSPASANNTSQFGSMVLAGGNFGVLNLLKEDAELERRINNPQSPIKIGSASGQGRGGV